MNKGRGYEISRAWFNFAFENPDKVTSNHTALFLFLSEINNRMGWADCFQITASECMAGMSCKSYNTYKKCIDDLIKWEFVNLVKRSVNQYQCNVVALSKFDKASNKALDKAIARANDNPLYKAPYKSLETFINKETDKPIETKKQENGTASFQPPSIEETQLFFSEYCSGSNWDDERAKREAVSFHSFYESKGWMVGKTKMKKWKQAVVGWMNRNKGFVKSEKTDAEQFAGYDPRLHNLDRYMKQLVDGRWHYTPKMMA